jgi:hypothetical protein
MNRMNIKKTNAGDSEINNLVQDMLVNGTDGDRTKWKRAFSVLRKDKKMMKKVLEIDSNKAFEKYYMLGPERSLTALSRVSNHELNKLSRWRRDFDWETKVAERDEMVGNILKAKAVTNVALIKIEYCGFINKLIRKMLEQMDEYNKRVEEVNKKAKTPKDMVNYKSLIYNAEDFERLIKLELLLRGESIDSKKTMEISYTDRETLIEEQIANDEETKVLLKNLYNRTTTYISNTKKLGETLKKIGNNGNGKEIDITEGVEDEE